MLDSADLAAQLLRAHLYHQARNAAKAAKIAARPKPVLLIVDQGAFCGTCGRILPAGVEAARGPAGSGTLLHVACWADSRGAVGGGW